MSRFSIKGNYAQNKIFEVYLFKRQNRLFIEFTYWVNIRSAKIYYAKIYYAKIYYAKIYYAKIYYAKTYYAKTYYAKF